MSKTFSRDGQLHYCSLLTALVSDQAVKQGLLAPKNILPVLGFFFEIARNEKLRDWLLDDKGRLRERRWLQALNFLIEEQVFKVSKKSRIVDCLIEQEELTSFKNSRQMQSHMCRPLEKRIKNLLELSFLISKNVVKKVQK